MSQIFLTEHQKHQLQEQLKTTRDTQVYRRTLALLAVDQGQPIADIAWLLQIGRRTLYDWIDRCRECRSPKALLHQPGQGRPSLWTKRQVATLNSVLRKSPQDLGYPANGWTTSLLQEHLFDKTGLVVSENTLRRQLHSLSSGWVQRGFPAPVPISGSNAKRVVSGIINLRTGCRLFLARENHKGVDFQSLLDHLHDRYRGWQIALLLERIPAIRPLPRKRWQAAWG